MAGPSAVAKRSAMAAGVAAEPLWRLVDERVGDDRARPVAQPIDDGRDARVADVGDDRRVRRARAQPGLEGRLDGGPVGEDVRVVPLGAGQDRQRRAGRVEVAGVLVGLDDEGGRRCPSEPSPAGRR